jgi:uncharacterized membrane protein
MERTRWLVHRRRWDTVRAKGLWHFVLFRGVLYWGATMFAVMSILLPLLSHRPHAFETRTLLINAVIWLVAGVAWALLTWWLSERLYARHDNDSQANFP